MSNPTPGPAASNQDKLAGLAQPTPASSPAPTFGVPPWEGRATESAPYYPSAPQAPPPHIPPVVVQPPGLAGSGMPLAGIWNRTWCWFLDSVVAGIVAIFVTGIVLSPLLILAPDAPVVSVLILLGVIAVFVSYFAMSYRWWGRTPVMMMPRLYVIDEATGSRLTWGRAYLRSVVLACAQLFGIVAIIWIAIAGGNTFKQGPHDKAGKSLVVQRPR